MGKCRDTQSSYIEDNIYEDEKGKYRLRKIYRQQYCNCHPETCPHFNRMRDVFFKEERIYLNEE